VVGREVAEVDQSRR